MMMGFGFIGVLFMLIFWGGLIALVVWIVNQAIPNIGGKQSPPSDSELRPREILDQRYARGEIEREQYDRMKKDIKD
jgi:putative membrane protein